VDDPGLANADRFRQLLAQQGVGIPAVRRAAASGATPIATHSSAALDTVVSGMLKDSDPFVAEMLLRELGAGSGRRNAAGGLTTLSHLLATYGIGAAFVDGSGLSQDDLESASGELAWLQALLSGPFSAAFARALPVACADGTLKHRQCGYLTAGVVHAKTGTLAHTVALTGYTTLASGQVALFSFILGNVDSIGAARLAVDRAAELVSSYRMP